VNNNNNEITTSVDLLAAAIDFLNEKYKGKKMLVKRLKKNDHFTDQKTIVCQNQNDPDAFWVTILAIDIDTVGFYDNKQVGICFETDCQDNNKFGNIEMPCFTNTLIK
jgi:hypothetical protein